MSDRQWDFECPQFIDFNDPKTWTCDEKENDAFFGLHSAKIENKRKQVRSFSATVPIAPKLTAVNRNRLATINNEQRQMKTSKPEPFKATPLNRNLFEEKYAGGVPKVTSVKSCSKPVEFRFKTDERLKARRNKLFGSGSSITEDEKQNTFIKPAPIKKLAEMKPFDMVEKELTKCEKDVSAVKQKAETVLKKLEKAQTALKPFKFTKPQPFHLSIEERIRSRHEKRLQKLNEQLNKLTVYTFHAQPCKVTRTQPFVPKKVHHSPVKFNAFHLHTEERAKERILNEQKKKEMEAEMEKEREKQRLAEIEAAKESMRQYRASLVHKPLPYKPLKPFVIKH